MSHSWIVLTSDETQAELKKAVLRLDPLAEISFSEDAFHLREMLKNSQDKRYCVAVGLTRDGVSDVNLSAAIVEDGFAHKVVLIRKKSSGSLRSRAARAGIDEVIDLSLMTEPQVQKKTSQAGDGGHLLRQDSAQAKDCGQRLVESVPASSHQSFARHFAKGKGAILTVCSGRGGVGKTALATSMAALACMWDLNVSLIDLDLALGNAASQFGIAHVPDMAVYAAQNALDAQGISKSSYELTEGLRLWGSCEHPETAELLYGHVGRIIQAAAQGSDLVLIDCATTPTDAFAEAALASDRLIIVSDQGSSSLSSLARMGGLAVRLGIPRTKIIRIENRADIHEKQNFSFARAELGLEQARAFRIFEGGEDVEELLAAGKVQELVKLNLPFVESLAFCLAQELKELGCLPDNPAAQAAAEDRRQRRSWWPFSRREEKSA